MRVPERIKILVPLWGDTYIEDFVNVSLPFLLAPDNAAALSEFATAHLCFLTTSESADGIRESYQRFCRENNGVNHPKFELLLIDDLISDQTYGVTLTLAYARAIMQAGSAQTQTAFIFLNSDMILADGSLHSVVQNLRQGIRTQYVPSLRVAATKARGTLRRVASESAGSRPSCRELTRIGLEHLHPTVLAKIVNEDSTHYENPNIFYWRINRETLLARHYLALMLCIWPEVPLQNVDSYCDYGFVPAMTPNGPSTVVQDSDSICLLELQEDMQESRFIVSGPIDLTKAAKSLSSWTTKEHRFIAEHEMVFHSKELPPEYAPSSQAFAEYMNTVSAELSCKPMDPRAHHFWSSGLAVSGLHQAAIEREFGPTGNTLGQQIRYQRWTGIIRSLRGIVYRRVLLNRSFAVSESSVLSTYRAEKAMVRSCFQRVSQSFFLAVELSDGKGSWVGELLENENRPHEFIERISWPPSVDQRNASQLETSREFEIAAVGPVTASPSDAPLLGESDAGAPLQRGEPGTRSGRPVVSSSRWSQDALKHADILVVVTDRAASAETLSLSGEFLKATRISRFALVSVVGGYWLTTDGYSQCFAKDVLTSDLVHLPMRSAVGMRVGSSVRSRLIRLLGRLQNRTLKGGLAALLTALAFAALLVPVCLVNRWTGGSSRLRSRDDGSTLWFMPFD